MVASMENLLEDAIYSEFFYRSRQTNFAAQCIYGRPKTCTRTNKEDSSLKKLERVKKG